MVCKKASMLRLLMLACFGVLLLASSSKGSDDNDGGGAGFTDSSTSLLTSVPEDIFAKDVADLPEELRDFVDLNEETISVKLPKSRDGPIVLPLLAAENKLSFNVFQEETCLEKEQNWQFSYPVENGNSSMDITWKVKGHKKVFLLQLFNETLLTPGTNFMGVCLNDKQVSVSDVYEKGKITVRDFSDELELPECALNASKYDVHPYESYFDMNFSIENVVSEDADKSGKCDITLKFRAAEYKFATTTTKTTTTTTTPEPPTEKTTFSTTKGDPDVSVDASGTSNLNGPTEASKGSNNLGLIIGCAVGGVVLLSVLVGAAILFWYCVYRPRRRRLNSTDGGAPDASAAAGVPADPSAVRSVPPSTSSTGDAPAPTNIVVSSAPAKIASSATPDDGNKVVPAPPPVVAVQKKVKPQGSTEKTAIGEKGSKVTVSKDADAKREAVLKDFQVVKDTPKNMPKIEEKVKPKPKPKANAKEKGPYKALNELSNSLESKIKTKTKSTETEYENYK